MEQAWRVEECGECEECSGESGLCRLPRSGNGTIIATKSKQPTEDVKSATTTEAAAATELHWNLAEGYHAYPIDP